MGPKNRKEGENKKYWKGEINNLMKEKIRNIGKEKCLLQSGKHRSDKLYSWTGKFNIIEIFILPVFIHRFSTVQFSRSVVSNSL